MIFNCCTVSIKGEWFNRSIQKTRIIELYRELYEILNQNTLASEAEDWEAVKPPDAQQKAVVKAMEEFKFGELESHQQEILDLWGVRSFLEGTKFLRLSDWGIYTGGVGLKDAFYTCEIAREDLVERNGERIKEDELDKLFEQIVWSERFDIAKGQMKEEWCFGEMKWSKDEDSSSQDEGDFREIAPRKRGPGRPKGSKNKKNSAKPTEA